MSRLNQEKIKSIILVTLIITCLIQIGILWDNQYHGIPISYLSDFFNGNSTDLSDKANKAREDSLKPFRIVVSTGIDESHWAIDNDNSAYAQLWEEFKKIYLKEILALSPSQTLSTDKWTDIISAKAFIYEFRNNINIELFAGLFNIKELPANSPAGIYKILISPWEDINYNLTVYILDENRIFKYVLPISKDGLSRDGDSNSFESVMLDMEKDTKLKSYLLAREFFSNRSPVLPDKTPISVQPDILWSVKGPRESKYLNYSNISAANPDILNNQIENNIETVAQAVLLEDKDYFDRSVDKNDTGVFTNSTSIFKISNSGLMEYRNLTQQDSVRGSINEAFKRALEFVSSRSNIVKGADIYLSSAIVSKENSDVYRFTFDYIVGDTPVIFGSNGVSSTDSRNAITIEANEKVVTNCRWYLKKFVETKDTTAYYLDFTEYSFQAINKIKSNNGSDKNDVAIKDISTAYELNENASCMSIVWVITLENGSRYSVPVRRK